MEDENMETNIEERNSVEISINAKGSWSGKVKVYKTTIEEARKKAIEEAELLATLIAKKNE